jgi:hypothetical protein
VRVVTLFVLVGCGAGGAARQATDADFRRVQVEEATLEAAATTLRRESATTDERARAAHKIRDAARAICAVADGTLDPDLAERCDRAERRARMAEHDPETTR